MSRAYEALFSNVLRRLDPESAHALAMVAVDAIGRVRPGVRTDPILKTRALGREFPTPFGLAAGFDKNAAHVTGLGALGFGHVEIGTVTARPQPGNDRPRLFRLVEDRALINRMGFNNAGAEAAARQLQMLRRQRSRPVIGVNIGKSRVVEVDDAVSDYVESATLLAPLADYLAINVSSPNTPGLRGLQELESLAPLLQAVQERAGNTPVLVKIAPDLELEHIEAIAGLAVDSGLSGIIATNTTIARDGLRSLPEEIAAAGAGGLSGEPLRARSLAILQHVRKVVPSEFAVIAVGGVATGDDVLVRLDEGADLVQGYTAFVYEGPQWARTVNARVASVLRARKRAAN
ncbi:quinone-dependent dihydroorotate dehydrogenase [Humidisolicoccus flavus]|uniref:quinone-dependent dihydroorotate dehydrogenase n=1 Tax=Humidisolicoccus flavus TaxID=3111414 RepID=UPI0032435C38